MDIEKFDYRQILIEEFERRRIRNPHYSQRAFARDLEISSGALSQILSGKRHLGTRAAATVADALSLNSEDKNRFIHLARIQNLLDEAKQIRQSLASNASPKLIGGH